MIITGLAAVGFLMMRASEMESDYTEKFWEDFYRECPWVVSSDLPENGRLSLDLETGLSQLIFREARLAFKHIADAGQIIFTDTCTGKLIWRPGEQAAPEGGE